MSLPVDKMNSTVDISKIKNHSVQRCFHVFDLSCKKGSSLHNDDWAVKEKVSCSFNILIVSTLRRYTVLKAVSKHLIT